MVSGEFASMKLLHDTAQHLTPAPIAWGTYDANPNIHFFLCEFVDMTEDIPDPQALGKGLAELHMKGLSPNGKYGFSVPTNVPRNYTPVHRVVRFMGGILYQVY